MCSLSAQLGLCDRVGGGEGLQGRGVVVGWDARVSKEYESESLLDYARVCVRMFEVVDAFLRS